MRPLLIVAAAALVAGCSADQAPVPSPTPAANGIAARAPAEVLAEARKALTTAASVHIQGGGTDGGGPLVFDLRFQGTSAGRGSVTIDHEVTEVLRIGRDGYLKATADFLRIQGVDEAKIAAFAGRYVKVAPTSRTWAVNIRPVTDPAGFIEDWLTPKGAVTRVDTRVFGGVQGQGLRFGTADGDTHTVYVALTGPARPLYLLSTGASEETFTGSLTFGEYGAALDLAAPPASQIAGTTG